MSIQDQQQMPAGMLTVSIGLSHVIATGDVKDCASRITPPCALAADVIRKFSGLPTLDLTKVQCEQTAIDAVDVGFR